MNIRNSFVAVLLLVTSTFLFSCKSNKHSKSKRLPGVWQAQPIKIDGKNNDWPSPYPEYDDKAMLGYAVSNDKENLYITVETGDLATELKILRNGLTVWIDRKGDKDEVTAINFPIPQEKSGNGKEKEQSESNRPARGNWQQGQGGGAGAQDKMRLQMEDRVKRALQEANEYSLQGFKSCNMQFPIMENDSCGIKIRMDIDTDNEFVWEAVVPLRTFYFKNEITRADKGRPISICFETEASKRPAGQGQGGGGGNGGNGGGMRPSMGFGPGGMGMRMGGGGGRGGRSNQSNPNNTMMEPLYKSTKTYKKFGLAFQ